VRSSAAVGPLSPMPYVLPPDGPFAPELDSTSPDGVPVEQHVRGAEAAKAGPAADGAEATVAGPDVVAVDNPKGGGKRLVRLETISFAQANGDYARIVCDDGRFLLRTPLSQLEKDWGASGFARVHRAYLVNLKHAVELRAQLNGTAVLIMRDDTEIPVARRNVAALRRRLHA